MKCGTILYDRDFQFYDTGAIIDKISIIVCERGNCHFVLITTGNPLGKGTQKGCQSKDKQPNFYVPKGSGWFDDPTWILLDTLPDPDNVILDAKILAGSLHCYENRLPPWFMKEVLTCALQSPLLDGWDKEFIQAALDEL